MYLDDNKVQIDIIRTSDRTKLRILGHPFGLEIDLRLTDLERLARYVGQVAMEWRREQHAVTADYYAVLGVAPHASADEIQQAFRQRAREHHPDVHDSGTHAAMQAVNEAYEILSNREKRQQYDNTL